MTDTNPLACPIPLPDERVGRRPIPEDAGMRPLVDPNCLCGAPHPCPTHGEWTGQHPEIWVARVLVLHLHDDLPRLWRKGAA